LEDRDGTTSRSRNPERHVLREHLFERLRERKIKPEDLYALKLWRESEPEAPQGHWYKDIGSFKICGEGKFPKTFLLAGQVARGKRL
jgi:hypothetical protein